MSTHAPALPLLGVMAGFRRFSVAEYHRLAEIGVLTEDDDLELIEGYLVLKMSRNPPHDSRLTRTDRFLRQHLPGGWVVRVRCAVTLADSEPEPDIAVVLDDPDDYESRHPGPADVGLVVEVADSSLDGDRADKGRVYARAGIPEYWIVNVPERQAEVYTLPSGAAAVPSYAHRRDYRGGDLLPCSLAGTVLATTDARIILG